MEIEKYKERKKIAFNNMFYSFQRIDLLIISICGAGIYTILESLKFLHDEELEISLLIKISGVCFVLGIITNFISQWFGYKSNYKDYLMCEAKIDAGKNVNESEQLIIDDFDSSADKFSRWTNYLNISSMVIMFVGLGTIMSFFLFIF